MTAEQEQQVIELLRCAEINCDNANILGIRMVKIVKFKIQEALKVLEAETVTPAASGDTDRG